MEVDVALPKLTLEPTAPMVLGDELNKLGMVQAFDAERADFSGIGVPPDPRKRLYVSQVFHKAFVKVDEKGTEAAAATAVVMAEGGGMPRKAIAFQVDQKASLPRIDLIAVMNFDGRNLLSVDQGRRLGAQADKRANAARRADFKLHVGHDRVAAETELGPFAAAHLRHLIGAKLKSLRARVARSCLQNH